MGIGGRRCHGVKHGPADGAVILMVHIIRAEEDSRRVGGQDGLRLHLADEADQAPAQLGCGIELTVLVTKPVVPIDPERPACIVHFPVAARDELGAVYVRVPRALVAITAKANVDLATGRRPAGESAPARDIWVVRVSVDREHPPRNGIQPVRSIRLSGRLLGAGPPVGRVANTLGAHIPTL
jgi:hypothetical protein